MSDRRYPRHVVLERTEPPAEETHRCRLPGFWSRRWWSVKLGAVVRCRTCHARFEWRYRPGNGFVPGYKTWTRLS